MLDYVLRNQIKLTMADTPQNSYYQYVNPIDVSLTNQTIQIILIVQTNHIIQIVLYRVVQTIRIVK